MSYRPLFFLTYLQLLFMLTILSLKLSKRTRQIKQVCPFRAELDGKRQQVFSNGTLNYFYLFRHSK